MSDTKELKTWALILHLSLLSGFVVPLIGSVLIPIVIYMVKKDELPGLEPHFNIVMNWIISAVIYGAAATILGVITFGILLPVTLLVYGVIALLSLFYGIYGAIKANDGIVWPYPLSIPFLGR